MAQIEMNPVVPQISEQPEPTATATPGDSQTQATQGKTITMPTNAMRRIRQEAQEKGKKLAQSEAEKRLRKLGYKSFDEMERALSALKAGKRTTPKNEVDTEEVEDSPRNTNRTPPKQPAQAQTQGTAPVTDRTSLRLQRENERLLEEKRRLNVARAHEEKKRRVLQRELDAQQAEHQLRLVATKHGVQDVEFALHLLRNAMGGKSEAELQSFDEEKFFGEVLRKERPYLYRTEEQYATTVPETAPTRGAQAPRTAQAPRQDTNAADPAKLSREEYNKKLRALGLTAPNASHPLG